MNHSQRNLKKLIRAKEDSIADEELFLSAAYQKYQTSLARAVTGRYRYGLQVLLDWDISEQAGVAYTDNYKVHLNAANPITQSFPTRFLRSQSLTGLTGHEVGHLLYSDFTAHAVHLRSLENGSFYPKEPELSLPAYQTALEEIKEVLEEKDKAGCLTLARCAATFQNILEDIHIEDRMCEEFHGTFRQGIELNNLRMSEQIPSIQEQIDKEYQPFSIIANLILSYCRTGNINNPTGYQGDYLDTISDCTDLLDTAMESEKGTDRMLVSNALLALTWNYIQPLIEKTREELEMHGEDSAADALEDLLGDEVSSGAPLPTGKSGAIPKNIKPASPKGSGNDEGNAPSGPRTKEDAIEEAKQVLSEEGGRIALTKTNTILDENNPGVTYVSQYQGSGYEHAAEDLFRILNDVAAEKVQEDCQTELTEELQKTANDIHYGNAHAGIHVTIHRLTSVSDYLKNEYQTVAPPLLRASKKLQSTILPLLKEEQQGGKQKNLLFGKRLDSHALYKTDGTIFTRTRLPGEEKRLAVALLIDESGSMGWGDRMTHARKTAIVLYDFCKSLGIPITIYGHSTDAGGVALYSYAEFDSVDNEDCIGRCVRFLPFNVLEGMEDVPFPDSRACKLEGLTHLGFGYCPFFSISGTGLSKEYAEKFIQELVSTAANLHLPIDGIVMIFDSLSYSKSCGKTGHHYKDGLAYKFEDDTYETFLREIEWTPTRFGEIAPVGIFDTVEIDGCDVSRASLHNLTFIKNLELVPGCRILVSKRNMIIPHIEDNLDRGRYTDITPPVCPCCGSKTRTYSRKTSDGRTVETLHCDNPQCDSQITRRFVHFASKKAMNIEGLSEATLEKFLNLGYLHSFQDIYHLEEHREDIVALDGYGEKSFDRLWESINASRRTSFVRYLVSMDIPMIGRTKSRILDTVFSGNLTAFEQAAVGDYDFTQLEDFGEILNHNIHSWFADEANLDLWKNLQNEFTFEQRKEETIMTKENKFTGCTIVATGKLEHFTRDGINDKILELGAKPGSSVTKKTDYLICGEKAGSKLAKAQSLGIPILTEAEFLEMIA